MTPPQDVLDFWIGGELPPPPSRMKLWFQKSEETDQLLEERFGDAVRDALAGELDHWADEPQTRLALIILLDQFTRNIFRGTPRAFAGDPIACALALDALEQGWDQQMRPGEVFFILLPLEHQEDIRLQERCVELMGQLADRDDSGSELFGEFVKYAVAHRDVIAEFGRFPHRNSILNRPNTPEEAEYLSKPGAGF